MAAELTDETRAVLDALPIAVVAGRTVRDAAAYVLDVETIFVNTAAEEATGVPRARQVGARLGETVEGFRESEVYQVLLGIIQTGEPATYETPWWRGARGKGIFLARGVRFGDGYLAVFEDVTDSRAAAADLRASELRLAEAQKIAHVGVWEWDIRHDRVFWSDELYRIYGVSQSDYAPSYQGYLDRVHPEDREYVASVIESAYRDGKPFSFDERIVRPDGTVRSLHSGGRVTMDAKRRPVRMLGVCHDVTDRAQTETALAAARADLERRRFSERQAAQINEGIIDGLVTAMQALDDGNARAVRLAMRRTLEQASRIVTDLQTPARPV